MLQSPRVVVAHSANREIQYLSNYLQNLDISIKT